jgi:type II secretory ATPase GspE/PulE/Tfp pilus assembly ATPase PilB-like protein
MRRLSTNILPAAVVGWALVLTATPGWAQGWPAPNPQWATRETGGGLSILPLVCWWLQVVGWAMTSDWITRDSAKLGIRPNLWGALAAFPFTVAALLAWVIPSSIAGQVIMALAWLVPALVYAGQHNAKAGKSDKVLTSGHMRRLLSRFLAQFGVKMEAEVEPVEALPPLTFQAVGGKSADDNKGRLERAMATEGIEEAKKILQMAVSSRASTVLMEWSPTDVNVRHEVDGVWMPRRMQASGGSRRRAEVWADEPPMERHAADAALLSLKVLCGLDPKERRGRLAGTFAVQAEGKPRTCKLMVQSAPTGEQALIHVDTPTVVFKSMGDLGVPKPISDTISHLLGLEKGLVLLSSPAASGLSTTFDVVVSSADRLLRDFISIEDAAAPPREIQNVKPVRFDARANVTPVAALEAAMREYPSGIVTRDLRDKELALELIKHADDSKLVVMSLRASDAIDAVSKLLAVGIPPDLLARTLLGSLSQRLVRKICPKCREEIETTPEMLAKFKKTKEELPTFKRPSETGCRICSGTSYFGRTAIFELASGETLRMAIAKKADAQVLRQAAAKDGLKPMRDEGMRLVLDGTTAMEEMQRIFAPKTGS